MQTRGLESTIIFVNKVWASLYNAIAASLQLILNIYILHNAPPTYRNPNRDTHLRTMPTVHAFRSPIVPHPHAFVQTLLSHEYNCVCLENSSGQARRGNVDVGIEGPLGVAEVRAVAGSVVTIDRLTARKRPRSLRNDVDATTIAGTLSTCVRHQHIGTSLFRQRNVTPA